MGLIESGLGKNALLADIPLEVSEKRDDRLLPENQDLDHLPIGKATVVFLNHGVIEPVGNVSNPVPIKRVNLAAKSRGKVVILKDLAVGHRVEFQLNLGDRQIDPVGNVGGRVVNNRIGIKPRQGRGERGR